MLIHKLCVGCRAQREKDKTKRKQIWRREAERSRLENGTASKANEETVRRLPEKPLSQRAENGLRHGGLLLYVKRTISQCNAKLCWQRLLCCKCNHFFLFIRVFRQHRFRGLTVGDAAGTAAELESLQVPQEFYLPEAMPTQEVAKGVEVEKESREEESEDDDGGGFLSFGTGAMEVDA